MQRFRRLVLAALWASVTIPLHADWRHASPGWEYAFPQDEYAHPDFKTEWWYFTGNLRERSTGRRFGYQLTFFRQGIRPPGDRPSTSSEFVIDHFWFAHFAVSDLEAKKFHATEQVNRGAFDEAGSGAPGSDDRLVWNGDWTLRQPRSGCYALSAATNEFALHLDLTATKPVVFHGSNGISAKSLDAGNASHYFSHTRLTSTGSLRIGDRSFQVEGNSWFDREWSTSVLGEGVAGWDWFSIQLDGNVEIMLFQLRRRDGRPAFVSGTIVDPGGKVVSLADGEVEFHPGARWKNPQTGVAYPVEWRAEIPKLKLSLNVRAALPDQELRLATVTYWEGATDIVGTREGQAVKGLGYLEMTGYGSNLAGLR